jgi:hypothetical protein
VEATLLTESDKLRVRIENTTRGLEADYQRTLKTVAGLKEKMNSLEQRISKKKPNEAHEDMNSLRSERQSLDKLTDSLILKSKEAWKKHEELNQLCKTQRLKLSQLDELQTTCKKTEQLAADLLCYSLGMLERRKPGND